MTISAIIILPQGFMKQALMNLFFEECLLCCMKINCGERFVCHQPRWKNTVSYNFLVFKCRFCKQKRSCYTGKCTSNTNKCTFYTNKCSSYTGKCVSYTNKCSSYTDKCASYRGKTIFTFCQCTFYLNRCKCDVEKRRFYTDRYGFWTNRFCY